MVLMKRLAAFLNSWTASFRHEKPIVVIGSVSFFVRDDGSYYTAGGTEVERLWLRDHLSSILYGNLCDEKVWDATTICRLIAAL